MSAVPPEHMGLTGTATGRFVSGLLLTVTIVLLPPTPVQLASLTETIVYVVVVVGLTAGILMELKNDGICADVVVPSEYWKSQGPVPVKFTVKFTEPPSQIVVPPVMIAVGAGKIV